MKNKFDAIVIGGGMTGSYAAKNLCEAGLKVLLLERGPEKTHPTSYKTITKQPWDEEHRGIVGDDLKKKYGGQIYDHTFKPITSESFVNVIDNPYQTPNGKPFTWVRSYQLGGKSLLWGRQTYRFSDLDFSANANDDGGSDWPFRYKDIEKYYDEVENFIGVAGSRDGIPQLPDGNYLPPFEMNDMELLAKEKIAKKWPSRQIISARTANLTRPHQNRGQCINRIRCAEGCSHGGYYSGLSGAIPAASATGNLTIKCDSIVERLVYDKVKAKATSVRVLDANTKQESEFFASIIFVCAGTLNTTWLLMNSAEYGGVGLESGQLGHNLMDHHSMLVESTVEGGPNTFPQGDRPNKCYLPRFQNLDGKNSDGFKRGYGYQLGAQRKSWRRGLMDQGVGANWKDGLSKWGDWSFYFVGFGETLPYYDNRVELDHKNRDAWGLPTLHIAFEFKENEKVMNQDMINSAIEMLVEMGGRDPQVLNKMSVPGANIHEMGTARMGRDRGQSVLDPWNRMWEATNVFVTDGAAMVSSACQNPSLTYMAMTARACRTAVKDLASYSKISKNKNIKSMAL